MGINIKEKIEFIKHYLSYDANTGNLIWLRTRSNRASVGSKAGCVNTQGYSVVQVGGCLMYHHHIAWALYHKEWPMNEIDHINGNRNDNRIANLRLVTSSQNSFNMRLSIRNTSGIKGVHWDDVRKKWEISIKAGAKRYRKRFADKELAELVAIELRDKYHKEFARHA